jgi:hypothetical protein
VKRLIAVLILGSLLAGAAVAQIESKPTAPVDKNSSQLRSVTGTVLGKEDSPLPNAVVYLKNTKTLAVRTYIANTGGEFQFNALSPNVDYELFAEYEGKKSDAKTVSSFDSRPKVHINLRIDMAPKK